MLVQFVDYLAKIRRKYRTKEPKALSTGYQGVYQLYDWVRKRTRLLDENGLMPKATPQKASTKKAPVKAAKDDDADQILDKEHIVQVEALDDHGIGLDEKRMPFRKDMEKVSASTISHRVPMSNHSKRISKGDKTS